MLNLTIKKDMYTTIGIYIWHIEVCVLVQNDDIKSNGGETLFFAETLLDNTADDEKAKQGEDDDQTDHPTAHCRRLGIWSNSLQASMQAGAINQSGINLA